MDQNIKIKLIIIKRKHGLYYLVVFLYLRILPIPIVLKYLINCYNKILLLSLIS